MSVYQAIMKRKRYAQCVLGAGLGNLGPVANRHILLALSTMGQKRTKCVL